MLGERLDPEPLRELLGRWYEEMRIAVERHGGTVEKFVGDAVLAVFGLPVKLVGVGEQLDDLRPFDPHDFARALVS
jgi:class 3 adenylate cyclase